MFKENELDIAIQCNMKIVNYWDVILNLENSTYHSYQKENNQIKYIKQLLLSIESGLSLLSSSEEISYDSLTPDQDTSEKSGYKHKLK